MVLGGFGGFRKVREVNWKHFLQFSSISDPMVPSYDQKPWLIWGLGPFKPGFLKDVRGVEGDYSFRCFLLIFVVLTFFSLGRVGLYTVRIVFSLPRPWSNSWPKIWSKTWPKICPTNCPKTVRIIRCGNMIRKVQISLRVWEFLRI